MNKFAQIKKIATFKKVVYYSVCLEEDQGVSLFELFLQKHTVVNLDKLTHIQFWLKEIGNKYGARTDYFRNEAETADTSALPPLGKNRQPAYVENGENTPNNLRLYCFRLNESVVFLFNGDIKTADTAQNCDNVKDHFKLANQLTSLIEVQINTEIIWVDDFTDIEFDDNFELNWE